MPPSFLQRSTLSLSLCLLLLAVCPVPSARAQVPPPDRLFVPYLSEAPAIDGDLGDWKDNAFHDGVWDIYRIQHETWYDEGRRNRLTDQAPNEPRLEDDLRARYYIAWDDRYIYMGAEVVDNVNDVDDPEHAARRWMFKDSICWFIEAPGDEVPEEFARGDNAFCFVIDERRPSYNTWWRHGAADARHLEEPIPPSAVEYAIKMNPWGTGEGDFILEARVEMAATFPKSDPDWRAPRSASLRTSLSRLGLSVCPMYTALSHVW